MASDQEKLAGSGKALGVSVLAAGAMAALAGSLFGRGESKQDKAEKQVESRLAALESTARQSIDDLTKAVSSMQVQAEKKGGKASSKARKGADEAVKTAVQRTRQLEKEVRALEVMESAHKLGNDVSGRANEVAKSFAERGATVLSRAQSDVPTWRNTAAQAWTDARARSHGLADSMTEGRATVSSRASQLAADAGKLGESVRADVRDQAPAVKELTVRAVSDVTERGKSLLAEAQKRAPEVRSQVEDAVERVTSQAKEKGPGLLESVGHQLTDALEDAQKRARPVVGDVIEQAALVGSRFSHDVVPDLQHRAHDVTSKVETRAHSAGSSLSEAGKGATERLSQTTSAVEVKSKQAASAAGRGTKDLGALLGWTAAAAGVVYVTFLGEKQKRKVKESGKRIASEVGSVIRDIRGNDGQFS